MFNPLYVVWDPDPVFFTIPQLVHADIPFGLLVKILVGIIILRLIYNLVRENGRPAADKAGKRNRKAKKSSDTLMSGIPLILTVGIVCLVVLWLLTSKTEIRYYGLMWMLAILFGAMFFDNFCKREGLPSSVSESIFIYGTLATIIGSRVGHCLFYEPDYFLAHPLEIITGIRNGGMASHGAAVGLLIGLWLFSRKNRLPYVWSLDRIMIPVAIGGAIVRFGNLLNSEIVGNITDKPWGFKFLRLYRDMPVEAVPVQHPTQLYEALCYVVTFLLLIWLYYRRNAGVRRPGLLFGVGLIGVFLTRFLIEFIKEDQEAFEQGMLLNMGQLLSIPFVLFGAYMIWRALRRPVADPAPKAGSAASEAVSPETIHHRAEHKHKR